MSGWINGENKWIDIYSRDLVMCPILLGFYSPKLDMSQFHLWNGPVAWPLSPQEGPQDIERVQHILSWSVTMLRSNSLISKKSNKKPEHWCFFPGKRGNRQLVMTDLSDLTTCLQSIWMLFPRWCLPLVHTDTPSIRSALCNHELGLKCQQIWFHCSAWMPVNFPSGTTKDDNCMLSNLVWMGPR